MNTFSSVGKLIILAGAILIVIGVVMVFFDKIPLLGKLPGDISIKRRNFTLYFPIVTSILLSIVLTVLLNLFGRK